MNKPSMQTWQLKPGEPGAERPIYQNREARRRRGALLQAALKGDRLETWKRQRNAGAWSRDLEGALAVVRLEEAEKRRQHRLERPARLAERRAAKRVTAEVEKAAA